MEFRKGPCYSKKVLGLACCFGTTLWVFLLGNARVPCEGGEIVVAVGADQPVVPLPINGSTARDVKRRGTAAAATTVAAVAGGVGPGGSAPKWAQHLGDGGGGPTMLPSRQLPTALIIGVKKGGTRALLEFLRLHPAVRAAGSEVHFFDHHYSKGFHWYRRRMPPTLEGQITMEKTPSYFVTSEAPRRVRYMNPGTKLIVVVRDPVTRAISDYTQVKSKRSEMPRFEELAFLNGSRVVDTSWVPLKIGVYARHLERWLRHFPLRQILFVSGERLIADPVLEITRVQDFLGLKRVICEKHFYFNATKGFPCLVKAATAAGAAAEEERATATTATMPHCLGKNKGRSHPRIDPTAIERLRDFYRPFNRRFYQLTGMDFGWL